MKTTYNYDGTIMVSGSSKEERFERIWGGIGFPGTDPGYLCVIGERTDGRYHALWELRGSLAELGEAAVEAKHRLLTDVFWIDGSDEIAAAYFRTLEGLTRPPGVSQRKDPIGLMREPALRYSSQSEQDTVVAAVPERLVSHFRSALDMTRGLINSGKLLVHAQNCPVLLYTLRQPVDDVVGSPVSRAIVWVLSGLETSSVHDNPLSDADDMWYATLGRS